MLNNSEGDWREALHNLKKSDKERILRNIEKEREKYIERLTKDANDIFNTLKKGYGTIPRGFTQEIPLGKRGTAKIITKIEMSIE